MSNDVCTCCDGSGRLPADRPLCSCAIQRRDTRSPHQLDRTELTRLRFSQQLALRGIAFDDHGDPLPEHGRGYVDYVDGGVRT